MAVTLWEPEEGADGAAIVLGRLWKDIPARTHLAILSYTSNEFDKGIDVNLLVEASSVIGTLLDLDPRGGYIDNNELDRAFEIASEANQLQSEFAQEAARRLCTLGRGFLGTYSCTLYVPMSLVGEWVSVGGGGDLVFPNVTIARAL